MRTIMRRRLAAAVAILAAASVTALGGLTAATAQTTGLVTAELQTWGTSSYYLSGQFVVRNTTTTAQNWSLTFTVPHGQFQNHASASVTSETTGDRVTLTPTEGRLSAGSALWISFGIQGNGSADLTLSTCSVNGSPVTGCTGSEPTPTPTPSPQPTPDPTPAPTPAPSGQKTVGYFAEWGVYGRNYHVKNIETSGSAEKLTHILYSFGNTTGGTCSVGDSYAAYEKAYTAAESVDGVADTWDQPLRGSFNQLRKLKAMHPGLKVLWSMGGWTWSGGFSDAAKKPAAFAASCKSLVDDPRWAGIFDGIDIDWEYPNACGLTCDTSGPDSFAKVIGAVRKEFGPNRLVTAATTADASPGGNIDKADYAAAVKDLDWMMPMSYDYFGAWNPTGPTAPHSPLTAYPGIPKEGFNTKASFDKLTAKGIPAEKLLLGVGFYGRGWTGVTQAAPGGAATGAAPGIYKTGIQDYKVLKKNCPATGIVGGTAYAKCGTQWWSYDTPQTIGDKAAWAVQKGMGGTFFWELSGDTPDGELIDAIHRAQS